MLACATLPASVEEVSAQSDVRMDLGLGEITFMHACIIEKHDFRCN
jgi:hypothetical protein